MEPTSIPLKPSQKSSLELLSDEIRAAVEKRQFDGLSETQERAIPPVLEGRHLLLIAPTGTGKTESAMLPVFENLIHNPGSGFRAIYITPLRALNRDIVSRLQWWCSELGLTVGVRHGDTSQYERRKQATNPPDLLVTTPETLQALFMGKRLRKHLKNVRYVIIDEIHELAGSKRGAQLSVALERLVCHAGEFRRIGLSATVGNPEEVGRFLCGNRPFSLVEIPAAPHLDISVRFAGDNFSKQAAAVGKCLDHEDSSLVFVNTRVTAEALGNQLYERGDLEVHHGSLSRDIRIEAEERFKDHEISTLICTSSMELGIDIGHIGRVIQFGSPREVSRLVQRVGRAGHRLNTLSHGTVLATGFDDLLESLVIARRAKADACENVSLPEGAADVLANQVAALAVEYREISFERVAEIISASACFSDEKELLSEVCRQMEIHRLIRIEDRKIIGTGRCRKYLYSNLSMIPDERKVTVFDTISRRTVGTLDDSFVVGWIHTGAAFITKGQIWEVLDIEDGKIMVAPARLQKGELPSWEGEQIPVPFCIAQEVGALRRTRDFSEYTPDAESGEYAENFFRIMDQAGARVADDLHIILEHFDEGVVINLCAGHRVNETLARVISILLSARFGTSVGIETGAYRIVLRLPSGVHASDVMEVLESLEPDHIHGILSLALKRTSLFKWKLVQIAKKFGAIDTDADYEHISINRLMSLFDGTVIQKETYRELFSSVMDVEGAAEVIRSLREGRVTISIAPLSPLGREGLSSSHDMIPPPGIDQAVISTLKHRLENDRVILFCMHCRKWKSRTVVSRVPDSPQCPLCGARLIAALKPWEDDQIAQAKRQKKTKEDRAVEARLLKNANIVLSSGKTAVTALAARGVGPDTASRIIATQADGDRFYREILKAERNYIKTHRFW